MPLPTKPQQITTPAASEDATSSQVPQTLPSSQPPQPQTQPPEVTTTVAVVDDVDIKADPSLPDPSIYPPARASSSAPPMDPTVPGTIADRPVYEVDIQALAEKNWRRPGSDLSDWFNYGFDEISWEAYCVRRRDLNALASDLKGGVLVRCSRLNTYFLTNTCLHLESRRHVRRSAYKLGAARDAFSSHRSIRTNGYSSADGIPASAHADGQLPARPRRWFPNADDASRDEHARRDDEYGRSDDGKPDGASRRCQRWAAWPARHGRIGWSRRWYAGHG